MENRIEVDTATLIFAFRYALNRNTSAPWAVCTELKRHWGALGPEFQRQVKEDIQREIRLKKGQTDWVRQISEDWVDMLQWIDRQQ